MMKNLLGKVLTQSTCLCFRHESHGGHRAHEQARIRTKAANDSGRKTSLYTGLGMRHRSFHEINGASLSFAAARNLKLRIHGNSTWNVEEPITIAVTRGYQWLVGGNLSGSRRSNTAAVNRAEIYQRHFSYCPAGCPAGTSNYE